MGVAERGSGASGASHRAVLEVDARGAGRVAQARVSAADRADATGAARSGGAVCVPDQVCDALSPLHDGATDGGGRGGGCEFVLRTAYFGSCGATEWRMTLVRPLVMNWTPIAATSRPRMRVAMLRPTS